MNDTNTLLLCDYPSAGVARVRINRPQARNALNAALRRQLADTFLALDRDKNVRCVLLCGSEGHFAAGADLKELAEMGPHEVWALEVPRYWRAIADCSKPVVAAVSGYALGGGCELALHADIIVAGRSACLGLPEVKVGVMPGGGATQRLMRALGKYHAMKLLLTGEAISAGEAFAMGLVSEVVDDDACEARALALAEIIASRPPVAVRLIKEAALAGGDAALATGLLLERRSFELLFDTDDQKEGMNAFIQRRAPAFSGQ
ncbi:putative enoyl-CoA hydratase echA8 [Paraburkholderia domus]|uniref:enoyl-CoA hydratase-related protein n=1 Tax=Paraburkholderia domus TaxID=2793075 RepID=UPI001912D8FA|nr:enoyl-CoA hydratase-related protein [Paraburkholderia domus]MBK5050467.1 enoyl-CoA hydratase/isomerase family protein [Burkholderia sp. R-70006]CAE6754452.1 putative enoyl-CoA hydratase echA8 [Paraburkholderia domus]